MGKIGDDRNDGDKKSNVCEGIDADMRVLI